MPALKGSLFLTRRAGKRPPHAAERRRRPVAEGGWPGANLSVIHPARDAAHGRLAPLVDKGETLPIDVKGQIIYYTGPSPARPRAVIGSVGPTRASRMGTFTPALLAIGLKGTISKGSRGLAVKDALKQHKTVYFGAIGGAGAVLSEFVKKAEVVAYEDPGTEVIRRLEVEGLPAMVLYDCHGGDLCQEGQKVNARENA